MSTFQTAKRIVDFASFLCIYVEGQTTNKNIFAFIFCLTGFLYKNEFRGVCFRRFHSKKIGPIMEHYINKPTIVKGNSRPDSLAQE